MSGTSTLHDVHNNTLAEVLCSHGKLPVATFGAQSLKVTVLTLTNFDLELCVPRGY
jgi:hypothetical protein